MRWLLVLPLGRHATLFGGPLGTRKWDIFYRRPQSFGQWYVNWLCLRLIYPVLWRAVEFQIWASPDRWIALFVLVMSAAVEALFSALVFHLSFYRLVGRLKGKGSETNSDPQV